MTDHPTGPPIVCDMTGTADTIEERVAAYRTLFASALVGRERTATGIRFRLRSAAGVEETVRDLVAREQACCAFFTFVVAVHGDEVWWDAGVVDDPAARRILDGLYDLPDMEGDGSAVLDDLGAAGLDVLDADGAVRRSPTA